MAWEWGHAPEAYETAEKNLRKMSLKKISEIYSEWVATDKNDNVLDNDIYDTTMLNLKKHKTHTKEAMCDLIWKWASEQRTCTNGGWEAWMCPHGCGCHMAKF